MRKTWCAVGVIGLLLGMVQGSQSDDPKDARAILDKAIKALGGAANLGKAKAVVLKGTGTFHGLGEGIPFTGEWSLQAPRQIRVAMEVKASGQTFRMARVVNGDKGWIKLNDDAAMEMSKDLLAEEREELYAGWVTTLAPLQDKAFHLAVLGEVRVRGGDAVGIRVSREGHRDVNLFFDKTSGLPVKVETIVKDVERSGDKEFTQALFPSDFKEIDGVKRAMKYALKRDGKAFVEGEWSEVRPLEKLDDSVFAKP